MSKDQKIKFPEVTAEEMQQSLQKDSLHLRALLFLKVVAVAVLINALFFLVTYLNGTFHPKHLFRGWYYGSYSNVPCILPEKLAGTWGIDDPYYEAVFCSLSKEMQNWEEIKLVLNKDGSFVFMNPPYYCRPYLMKKVHKEGDCVVLRGQWGLNCRIKSQFHWKHEYYCTFLSLKCDGEDEHAYVGMLLESDSPYISDPYLIKRITGTGDYTANPGFFFKRLSLETGLAKNRSNDNE